MVHNKPIRESLEEYARGIVGGLLFSFPLLYTMEVWHAGFLVKPFELIIMVLVTYLLLLGYNRYAGMHPGTLWKNVFIDSFEEMGIGLVISFCMLLMLNRIHLTGNSLDEIMGKVIMEAMVVSIGVSIGTAQLGSSAKEPENKEGEDEPTEAEKKGLERRSGKMSMAVLAVCGSIVVGGSVAPTEEVLLIAVGANPIHILAMFIVSILLSLVVCYFSDFRGTKKSEVKPTLYNITFDTCLSYCIAFSSSLFVLWYFSGFAGLNHWNIIAQSVALGLIASLGASAGRLLIN